MKHNLKNLDEGQLDMMFNALRMGYQTPNIPSLKELCDQLRQAMIQKTGGNRENDPPYYTKHEDIGTIINCIVVETMCLYLSGELDKLEGDSNGE